MSPASTAAANRPARCRSRGEPGAGARSRPGRQPGLQGGAGALQGALDRGFGGLEHDGGFGGRVAEHVAEHQDGPLAGRQVLQGGDERQLDGLLGVVAGFRPGRGVGQAVEQHVGVGLDPDRVGHAGGLGRLGHHRHLPRAAAAVAQRVQAAVDRDAVQPGAHRGPALESGQAAPGRQQGLLQHVLGVGYRAEDLVAVRQQLAPVGVGELTECLLIARPCPGERACGHHRILHRLCPSRPHRYRPRPGRKRTAVPFRPPAVSQRVGT